MTQMAQVVVRHGARVHVLRAQGPGRARLREVLRGRVRAVAAVRPGKQNVRNKTMKRMFELFAKT